MKTIKVVLGLYLAALLVAVFFANADTTISNSASPSDTNAMVRGDMNDDGYGDVIVSTPGNDYELLSMRGFQVLTKTPLFRGHGIGNYTIAAVSDLSGDGIEDIILVNSQYEHRVLIMATNLDMTTNLILFATNYAPWHVVAGGDFDNDGFGDLILQYAASGIYSIALMTTNLAIKAADYLYHGVDISPWHIIGAGDFNGDQKADYVMQAGEDPVYAVTYMDGMNITDARYIAATIYTNLSPWHVSAISDLDGDGISDLVLQQTNSVLPFVLFMAPGGGTNSITQNIKAADDFRFALTNAVIGTIVGPR